MEKLRIALLSGGNSPEREVSINSGNQVFEALDKGKYEVIRYDPKTDLARLVADADAIDAAVVILHGPYGEDGTVQGLLDLLDIPYQGAGVLGSALAMNKLAAKRLYEHAGLPIPQYAALKRGETVDTQGLAKRFGFPLVVKPQNVGSSVGMSVVRAENGFEDAIAKAFETDVSILVEEYVEGIELTGGVLGNEDIEALPLIEIIPGDGYEFFDYEAKYKPGATREICPARVDADITAKAMEYAKTAHRALFCDGYSRTDMILRDGQLFVLETNTIPGMTPTSLFPQAAEAAGYSFGALLDKLINLGIEDYKQRR